MGDSSSFWELTPWSTVIPLSCSQVCVSSRKQLARGYVRCMGTKTSSMELLYIPDDYIVCNTNKPHPSKTKNEIIEAGNQNS